MEGKKEIYVMREESPVFQRLMILWDWEVLKSECEITKLIEFYTSISWSYNSYESLYLFLMKGKLQYIQLY